MDEKKWFILLNEEVSGPFYKKEIESLLNEHPESKLWWKGQNEWVQKEAWLTFIQSENLEDQNKERLWKIKIGDEKKGPLEHDELMNFLKTITDFTDVLIWTEGYKDWKEVYQIHAIMDDLGVSRRQHPRVPIMGTLTVELPQETIDYKLTTISEGGIGLSGAQNLRIGYKVKGTLNSPNLYTRIHALVEILYVSPHGVAGCRFAGLQSEFKSAIIEYVKKFSEAQKSL